MVQVCNVAEHALDGPERCVTLSEVSPQSRPLVRGSDRSGSGATTQRLVTVGVGAFLVFWVIVSV